MKTTGRALPRRDSSCCRAGPLMPGSATSRMRQSVWSTSFESRNSAAEENARAANPNVPSRSGSDSRTDTSSSTIDTIGAPGNIAARGFLFRSSEGEGEHLHSRIQELHLELPVDDRSGLANQ